LQRPVDVARAMRAFLSGRHGAKVSQILFRARANS
jgi:hypothetical protein